MYREILKSKWGEFTHENHYQYNCRMPFVSNTAVLNILFDPEDSEKNTKVFYDSFGMQMPIFLKNQYEKHNGYKLFFGSLSMFGFQFHTEEKYEPYDLIRENANNYAKMPNKI